MALATLSIDIEAKLAGLEAGLDRAARIAKQNADKIEGAFSGLKTVGVGLASSLAAAFSVGAIKLFVQGAVDGVDALNDLKAASGASIENISALEDVGRRAGIAFDQTSDILLRFNKFLGDAKPGSSQEQILKSIGLSAAELRRQDPAEALRQTAVALSGYADDGKRARLEQEIFNKLSKDASKFIADLGQQTALTAKVTAQQAEQAKLFNDQLDALGKNATDASRKLVSNFLPALNEILRAFNEKGLIAALDQFGNQAFDWERSQARKQIKVLEGDLEDLRKRSAALQDGTLGGSMRQFLLGETPEKLDQEILQREAAIRKLQETLFGKARRPANEGGGRFALPSAPDVAQFGGDKAKAPRFTAPESKALSDALAALERTDVAKIAALEAQLSELFNLNRESRGAPGVTQAIQETIDAIERIKAARIGSAVSDPAELQKIAFLRSEKEAYQQISEKIQEMDEFAQQAARNIQDTLGTGLRQILGGNFRDIGQLFKNMLLDMVAQATAARLGKALFGDLLSGGSGNGSLVAGFLKFFASANGNAFGPGGLIPFASGGVVSGATPFSFGGGQLGVMGEQGPEAILPLKRRNGKLGVASSGGGIVINQTVNAGQGVTPAQLYATVTAANRALVERLQAAGKL